MPRFFGMEKRRVGVGRSMVSPPSQQPAFSATSSSMPTGNSELHTVTPGDDVKKEDKSIEEISCSQQKVMPNRISGGKSKNSEIEIKGIAQKTHHSNNDNNNNNNSPEVKVNDQRTTPKNNNANASTGICSGTKKKTKHRPRRRKKSINNSTTNKKSDHHRSKEVECFDQKTEQASPELTLRTNVDVSMSDNQCSKEIPAYNEDDDILIDEDEIISIHSMNDDDDNDEIASILKNQEEKKLSSASSTDDQVDKVECLNEKQPVKPSNKDVLRCYSVSSPKIDCSIVKEIFWFPCNSGETSKYPKLGLKIPFVSLQRNSNTEHLRQLRFPCVIPDSDSTDVSTLFIVRTYSKNGTSYRENLEYTTHVKYEKGNGLENMSDDDANEFIRRQQDFATLQWETQILYVLFACALKNKIPSENYFPVPRLITYEKCTEKINLCLRMDIVTKHLHAHVDSIHDESPLILGTIQDILNLHIQFKSGPFPESIIAYFALQMLKIIEIVHLSGVTHNNISLNSFVVVREKTIKEGISNPSTEMASFKWTVRIIGFGATSSLVRCENINMNGSANPCGNFFSKCDKWHYEQDYYDFANIIHILLTGGVQMTWQKSDNRHNEHRNEICLRSFIRGNKYLNGSLAWDFLFDQLLNSQNKNSNAFCHREQSEMSSIGKQRKEGWEWFLSEATGLLESITARDMDVTNYMDELYRHLEISRRTQKRDTDIGNASLMGSKFKKRVKCSARNKMKTPHCNTQYQIYDLSTEPIFRAGNGHKTRNDQSDFESMEIPTQVMEEVNDFTMSAQVSNPDDMILAAHKNRVSLLEKELHEVMKKSQKNFLASRIEFEANAKELKERKKEIRDLKLHQNNIENKHNKQLREEIKKREQKIIKSRQNTLALELETNSLKQKIEELKSELNKKEKFEQQSREQKQEIIGLGCDLEIKESRIKELMFLLSKKQHKVANLEAQLMEYARAYKKLEMKLCSGIFYPPTPEECPPNSDDASRRHQERESLLRRKERIFENKVRLHESNLKMKSKIIDAKKDVLEKIFNCRLAQLSHSGKDNDSLYNLAGPEFEMRMTSLFEREAALLHRIRCFEEAKHEHLRSLNLAQHENNAQTQNSCFISGTNNKRRNNPKEISDSVQVLNDDSGSNSMKRFKPVNKNESGQFVPNCNLDNVQVPNISQFRDEDITSTCSLQNSTNST